MLGAKSKETETQIDAHFGSCYSRACGKSMIVVVFSTETVWYLVFAHLRLVRSFSICTLSRELVRNTSASSD